MGVPHCSRRSTAGFGSPTTSVWPAHTRQFLVVVCPNTPTTWKGNERVQRVFLFSQSCTRVRVTWRGRVPRDVACLSRQMETESSHEEEVSQERVGPAQRRKGSSSTQRGRGAPTTQRNLEGEAAPHQKCTPSLKATSLREHLRPDDPVLRGGGVAPRVFPQGNLFVGPSILVALSRTLLWVPFPDLEPADLPRRYQQSPWDAIHQTSAKNTKIMKQRDKISEQETIGLQNTVKSRAGAAMYTTKHWIGRT